MDKFKAIPQGYMTVGEVAKRMGTTVRTLQYYDREGILSPTSESEGGRRLYTDRDIVRLHQVQSMKYLGFSLDDIKNKLKSLETPEEVAEVLTRQAEDIRRKLTQLTEVLIAIEKLKDETLKMEFVNWNKYADIIVNLQMKNDFYGFIKHFDDDMLDHIRSQYDMESGMAAMSEFARLMEILTRLRQDEIPPDSEQGQALAREWWDFVMKFTGGDMSRLPAMISMAESKGIEDEKLMGDWAKNAPYISSALGIYLDNSGVNPFKGEARE
jgi:DNA-binding transcriptional MerR regulator